MSPPLVSVIIPTFNRATLLRDAMASVVAQRYSPLEIIVADDGSTDDTPRIVEGQPGVRHLHLEHCGLPARVRNRGADEARGTLLAFLDDDDTWEPDKLTRQVGALSAHPDAVGSYTDITILMTDGNRIPRVFRPHHPVSGDVWPQLLRQCLITSSTVLLRRDVFDRVGGFDETLDAVEDYDLWLRLAASGSFRYVNEPLATVNRGHDSITHQRQRSVWTNTLGILDRAPRLRTLTLAERLTRRRSMARAHTRIAEHLDGPDGRRHLRQALQLNPLQRRAWRTLFGRDPGTTR